MSNFNSLWNLQRRVWQRTRPLLQRIGLELNFRFFLRRLEFNPIFAFPRGLFPIFLQNDSDIYAKEALKSPMSTGKYFGWMKLQGLDVFPSNIMDIINTHRIFHYNEYCFVNNAVEIAPPIINIIPIKYNGYCSQPVPWYCLHWLYIDIIYIEMSIAHCNFHDNMMTNFKGGMIYVIP